MSRKDILLTLKMKMFTANEYKYLLAQKLFGL